MNDQNTHGSCVFEAEKNRRNRQRQAGFTLTEMIVVVYVAGLLSAIVRFFF